MNAAVLKTVGNLQVEGVKIPEIKEHELLIRVQMAGICGSDSSLYQGKLVVPFPVIPGHEAVGYVESVGSSVSLFQVGQRVTIHPNFSCGECSLCKKGLSNICRSKIRLGVDINGVFADYVVVPAKAVYPLPDSLPNEIAVFTEPLAVAVHALSLVGLSREDRVLVFGAGVIGQFTLQLALLQSHNVAACDLVESRLQLAENMGAIQTLGDKESVDACKDSFDVIFETSGAPSALEQAINLATPGGTIVVLGIPGQSHPVPTVQIVRKELKILGSMIYTDEIPKSIELLNQNLIKTEPLVSGLITLDQLQDNLDNFNSPQRMKTLVQIQSG